MPRGSIYPTAERLMYFSDLLAPARGQGNVSILAAFGKPIKPQALFWPRANIIHLPRRLVLQVAEYVGGQKTLAVASRSFSESSAK